ncbi:helix-turn-helix domain-containing protein [Abyssalbus ytuae]|uniref:Helix-turn-helix domain-containing protein n=1 Tax=Abyssalbus ytuae TaxID=2926907 RepID=A0A9E7CZI7_9FLAO|nr:helix-turn-helix transcriptional regulator [Abyssalbus ytuae]UOB17575.1 helix-turn-helix domain-containing protein [Abyssalbus ytuae]
MLTERLQLILQYYGLSASAFADSIGVQRSSISHILSGRNNPSLDFVMKIIDNYPEVDIYWLLNGKGTFPKAKEELPVQTSVNENTSPTLFDENSNSENVPPPQELIKNEKHSKFLKGSNIERIVVFYKDGTFTEYNNN